MYKTTQSIIPTLKFHTGNTIPQVGLGTYMMQGHDCIEAVKIAVKYGYRHIDTASFYNNEEDIAKALKELYNEKIVKREDLFITSKVFNNEQGYEKALAAGNNILKRLQTDYVDLLLIHWPGVSGYQPDSPEVAEIRLGTWKALEQLKKEGKVKDIGVSNFLVHHLEHLLKNSSTKPVVNQFELHPFCNNEELVKYCQKNDIVIEAYCSLVRNEDILMKNDYMLSLAEKYKRTVAQVALKWGLQNGFVVIPKSKSEKRLVENFELFDFSLTEEEMKKVNSMDQGYHTAWNPNSIKY